MTQLNLFFHCSYVIMVNDLNPSQFSEYPIAKISVTSPIVINVPTRELLAGETKSSFV